MRPGKVTIIDTLLAGTLTGESILAKFKIQ